MPTFQQDMIIGTNYAEEEHEKWSEYQRNNVRLGRYKTPVKEDENFSSELTPIIFT